MNNENSIVECFGKSMFCPELADVCADIAEEGKQYGRSLFI